MDASENGNGAGGGTELKPLADARVYRMTLKQDKWGPYYNDSYALGLVGIGWWEWARPSFREKLPTDLKDKLGRAISRGVHYGSPEPATPTGAANASEFPADKVAILLSEDLTLEEADGFRKHWSEIATKDLEKEGAEEVALFLSAREGDIVVTRDAGVLRWGLFAKDLQDPKGEAKGELQPLSVGGHICRPVRWAGSDVEAAKWAEHAGFLNAEPVTKGRWTAIRVFQKGVLGGRDTIGGIIGFKPQSGVIHMGRSGSSRHSSEEYPLRDLLRRSKSIILEGVPGTGKTYAIKNDICNLWEGVGQERKLGGKGDGHYAITLHPATSYEDFVEGLRPVAGQEEVDSVRPSPRKAADAKAVLYLHDGGEPELLSGAKLENHRFFHVKLAGIHHDAVGFAVQDGFFLRVCAEAVNNPEKDYVVLLDEFNRCNVPKVMGDLLTTMERSKRAVWTTLANGKEGWDLDPCQVVTLPASKRLFFVPENVYMVATMNSTDRSVAPLDSALRRRFAFHRCWPLGFDPQNNLSDEGDEGNKNELTDEKAKVEKAKVEKVKVEKARVEKVDRVVTEAERKIGKDKPPIDVFKASVEAWVRINTLLLKEGGPDALLGHSYLMDLADDLGKLSGVEKEGATPHLWVEHHWNHHILPQLADVLVTHSLELLLETKAAEAGEILKIKIGERRIVQPTATAREGRGQYGTLVLRLDERKAALTGNGDPEPHKVIKILRPGLVGEESSADPDRCGIWIQSSGGNNDWGPGVTKAIDALLEGIKSSTPPIFPVEFNHAPRSKLGGQVHVLNAVGAEDLAGCSAALMKLSKKPFACYFGSDERVQKRVEEICEAMRKAAFP